MMEKFYTLKELKYYYIYLIMYLMVKLFSENINDKHYGAISPCESGF